MKDKAWTFEKTRNDTNFANYADAAAKVVFSVKKKEPRSIQLEELYYRKPRNKDVDAPATAVVQTLRRLAPQVSMVNASFVSHNCKLPRSFLPSEYNLYNGAEPCYKNISDLAPYRRLTEALLSKSESLSPNTVLRELQQMNGLKGTGNNALMRMATKISNASKRGGLGMKNMLGVLQDTFKRHELYKRRSFIFDPKDRVVTVNTRSTNRLDALLKPEPPKRIQLQDPLKRKAWNFDRTRNSQHVANYQNAQSKVRFSVWKREPMRIIISNLYGRSARNKNVDAPVAAIVQALRRLAPVVEVQDRDSFVSHNLKLPRAYLPNEYNLFHGAKPTYANIPHLAPYRRLTRALLSKSESMTPNDVLHELKQMKRLPKIDDNTLVKMATTVSNATKRGGLNLKNTHDVLQSTFYYIRFGIPGQHRSFTYEPEMSRKRRGD